MQKKIKRPESVLVLLHDGEGLALMMERADRTGFWQSVTGSLEQGETPFAAALREVREETGIVLQEHQLNDWQCNTLYEIFPHWRHRYAGGVTHNREHWFSAKIETACVPQLSEHTAYRWLTLQEAAQIAFSPSNAQALLRLADLLKK